MISEWSLKEVKDLRRICSVVKTLIQKNSINRLKIKIKYKDNNNEVDVLDFETNDANLTDSMGNVESFIESFITEIDLLFLDKDFSHLELIVINKNYSLLTLGIKERYYTKQKSIKLKHTQKLTSMPFLKIV